MATVILNTRSAEAKKMLEFLKCTRYAKVIEEKRVNDETLSAISDIENGKVNSYNSVNDLMLNLKKKASVYTKNDKTKIIELARTGTHSDLFK